MKEYTFEELHEWIRKIRSLDRETIDPKQFMSPIFNKVYQTKEEAYRAAQVGAYKRDQSIREEDIENLVDDLLDDFLDRF